MQHYEALGRYVVCSSPFVSIFLFLFDGFFASYSGPGHSYLLPIIWQAGVNISIIAVEVSGTLIYLIGCRKKEIEDSPLLLVSGVLLVLWGVLVSYFTILLYNDFLEWASEPFRRAITVWDNLEYATWEIKGLLWVAAGLVFTVTQFRHKIR